MKKQLRNLIISLCIVVLLVVGVVVGTKIVGSSGSGSSSTPAASSTASIQVYKTTAASVSMLHVKNKKGEFTIRQPKKSSFTIDGVNTSVLNQTNLSSGVDTAANITATKLIEKNASNLAQYGLKNPAEVLDITSDSKTTTLCVGNLTPANDGYYFIVKGNNDVYKVGTAIGTEFQGTPNDFVNLSICGVDASSYSKLTEIRFGGASRSAPIILKEDVSASASSAASSGSAPSYLMTSPRTYSVNSDNTTKIVQGLTSLSASGVITLDYSDANLAKYGLKNAPYTFGVTYGKNKITLDIGTPFTENSTNYLPIVIEGTPVIYKIEASTLTFYNYQLKDICSPLLFSPFIDDIKSVTVSAGSESYTVNLSGTTSGLTGTYNGKKLDTKNIRNWYEHLIGMSFEGQVSNPSVGSDDLKIVFNYRNASKAPVTVEYKTMDARKDFWSINGIGDFYVLKDDVTTLLNVTRTLASGKTVSGT